MDKFSLNGNENKDSSYVPSKRKRNLKKIKKATINSKPQLKNQKNRKKIPDFKEIPLQRSLINEEFVKKEYEEA